MMRLALLSLLAVAVSAQNNRVFTGTMLPLDSSGVTGTVTVFIASGDTVAYAGWARGLETNLESGDCTAVNGCGVHIHEGTACTDASTQGGHFFSPPVTEDPWVDDRYSSDGAGVGTFSGIVTQGSVDIQDRVFVIHDSTGARVACGTLTEQFTDSFRIYSTTTAPIGDSGVTGSFTAYIGAGFQDNICMYGSITGLESSLMSFLTDETSTDCTSVNGCGVHVHEGTECTDTSTLGGHYYDAASLSVDPWLLTGYLGTDGNGNAQFIECVRSGFSQYQGQAFIVHANDGSRVSCGILGQEDPPTPPPTPPPTRAPSTAAPTTETMAPTFTMMPTTTTKSPTVPTTPPPSGTDSAGPSFGSYAGLLVSTTVFAAAVFLGVY